MGQERFYAVKYRRLVLCPDPSRHQGLCKLCCCRWQHSTTTPYSYRPLCVSAHPASSSTPAIQISCLFAVNIPLCQFLLVQSQSSTLHSHLSSPTPLTSCPIHRRSPSCQSHTPTLRSPRSEHRRVSIEIPC